MMQRDLLPLLVGLLVAGPAHARSPADLEDSHVADSSVAGGWLHLDDVAATSLTRHAAERVGYRSACILSEGGDPATFVTLFLFSSLPLRKAMNFVDGEWVPLRRPTRRLRPRRTNEPRASILVQRKVDAVPGPLSRKLEVSCAVPGEEEAVAYRSLVIDLKADATPESVRLVGQ